MILSEEKVVTLLLHQESSQTNLHVQTHHPSLLHPYHGHDRELDQT